MTASNCNCAGRQSKEQLLQTINQASFAVDDILLFLDTHPKNERALKYYCEMVALRKKAMKEYAQNYGPLTIDTADERESCSWDWVMQPWPWETKGGCR